MFSSADQEPFLSPEKVSNYCGWASVLRSWLWRFYDHLFHLCLINLGWFLTCFGLYWIAIHLKLLELLGATNLFGFYLLYLFECAVSVGWAFWTFNFFIEDQAHLEDFWQGTKVHFWKAIGLSAFSGFFIFLALYNIFFYFHLQSTHRFLDLSVAGFILWLLLFWISAVLKQWPILFFQNPPFWKIIYRSCLLVLSDGPAALGTLAFYTVALFIFTLAPFLWFFLGPLFFFSFQCVALEKQFLRYKITFKEKPLEPFLERLDFERKRGWREILKPWENR